GDPVCLIALTAAWPKAPEWAWLGQKLPAGSELKLTPVLSGVRLTDRDATNLVGSGGQAGLVVRLPTGVQLFPAFGPVVHLLLTHFGQGEALFPVTCTRDPSCNARLASPVAVLTVPLPSAWMTLRTQ